MVAPVAGCPVATGLFGVIGSTRQAGAGLDGWCPPGPWQRVATVAPSGC